MKKYDIVATLGSYTNKHGEEKKRYKNVGVVMEKDGKPFILLDRTFNPAGLQSNRDTVLLSLYEPKQEHQQDSPQQQGQPQQADFAVEELDDELMF